MYTGITTRAVTGFLPFAGQARFSSSHLKRVALNKAVYGEVQRIAESGGRRMTVVSSGHVSDTNYQTFHRVKNFRNV